MEFVDSTTDHHNPDDVLDNIDGIHIHKNTTDGTPENLKGSHQLNIFRVLDLMTF